jgi:hypothetical protein
LSAARAAAVVVSVVLAATLPFLGKAVHIDDVYFIEVAANILQHPLQPFAGAVALEDIDYRVFAAQGKCPATFPSMSHPPFVPYVLAEVAWLTGGFFEPWMHLAFVPFALCAGLAAHALARRFTATPLPTTLLIIGSPIFVLAAQSLSTDMAALALSLGALAFGIDGVDREERAHVVFAGFLAGTAAVTRYATLATVPLLVVYGLTRGKLRQTLPAFAGLLIIFGVWSAQNLRSFGQLHLVASSEHYRSFYGQRGFDAIGLAKKTLADLSALGGVAFVAAALSLVALRWRAVVFVTGVLAVVAVFVLRPSGFEDLATYSHTQVAILACCFAGGALLVSAALGSRAHTSEAPPEDAADQTFLLVWLAVSLVGAIVLLPFGTARYMLPTLAPLWLLVVRRVEPGFSRTRWWRPAMAAAVGQGLLLSLMLSLADADFAGRYRALAESARASQPTKTLWFVGEWGFRHYMHQVGGRYLRSTDETPEFMDLVLRPDIAGMHEMSPELRQRAVPIQTIDLQGRWPIRLMSFDAHAGYYSQHWGYLPWTFSRAPLERVLIFEIRSPPPSTAAPTTCASS